MSRQLQPPRAYLLLEMWEEQNGELTWRLMNPDAELPDQDTLESMTGELCEAIFARDKSEVIFSITTCREGENLVRYHEENNHHGYAQYLWTKRVLYRNQWRMLTGPGKTREPGLVIQALWSLEWFWHNLLGHFAYAQKTYAAAARQVAATPAEDVSEPSEGVENSPEQGGVVVPFVRRRKRDDLSEL